MVILNYEDYEIEIFFDELFSKDSKDNVHTYNSIFTNFDKEHSDRNSLL